VVEVYDASFRKTMSIYKDQYVMAAALSPEADRIVICSAVPEESAMGCEIVVCRNRETSPVSSKTYSRIMPLDVTATEDGFIVLCDSAILYLDRDGGERARVSLEGVSLKTADLHPERTVTVSAANALGSESRVLVTGPGGEILYDATVKERIAGAYASEDPEEALCWLRTSDAVIRVAPDGTWEKKNYPSGTVLSVLPLKNGALVAEKTGAGFFAD
jgi:hypothetical protein